MPGTLNVEKMQNNVHASAATGLDNHCIATLFDLGFITLAVRGKKGQVIIAVAINGIHTHASQPSAGTAVSTTSPCPLPPSSISSNGLPTPITSGTSTPCFPQQQPGAAATATTLTAPALGPAPATSSAAATATPALRGPGPGGTPGATVEYLRDLVQKRIITLTYMRNVHDGAVCRAWNELDRVFNNTAMKKRTHRFSVLAMSLSSLFDVSQPTDCLRSALNMLTEYEQAKGRKRPAKDGIPRLFSSASDKSFNHRLCIVHRQRLRKRQQKRHMGVGDYTLDMSDTSDTYLTIQHMPFPLDYTQNLLSLLDILSAFYAKLAKLLGPSPAPQLILGLSHPHPGVSYLFHNQTSADESLWSVALGSTPLGGTAGPVGHPGPLNSPPPSWTPALGEHVLKVDGKFKNIISVLLKDLDVFARNSNKDELASLDSLLRNVGGWSVPVGNGDEGRATYEFDPEQ
ncbi:hypothetical protein BGW80DRAFT_1257397 [Lactifluus volemus]|nr:hypothetical protein BGW80DRAFT_1257397 [Lactifluus volemus]